MGNPNVKGRRESSGVVGEEVGPNGRPKREGKVSERAGEKGRRDTSFLFLPLMPPWWLEMQHHRKQTWGKGQEDHRAVYLPIIRP